MSWHLGEYGASRLKFGEYHCPKSCCCELFERSLGATVTDGRKRCRTVAATANKLEVTQPAAFAELYKGYSMKGLQVQDDGAVH
eukprot:SAG22_NODE_8307_length_665_cov_1.454064_1_plen_83_part_10